MIARAAVAGIAAAAVVTLAPAAHASDRPAGETTGCVTGHEFAQLDDGMSRARVEELLDGDGVAGHVGRRVVRREYRLCGRTWDRGRVVTVYVGDHTQRLYVAVMVEMVKGTLGRADG